MDLSLDNTQENTAIVPVDTPEVAPKLGTEEYETWATANAQAKLAAAALEADDVAVPQKFIKEDGSIDTKAWAKSTKALEAALTQARQGRDATPPADVAPADPETPAPSDAPTFDRAKYTAEISTSGTLSDASYAELETKGYAREMVDVYIAGQHALLANARTSLLSAVGGESGWETLKSWGGANLSGPDQAMFDSQIKGSVESQKMALTWLQGKYISVNGSAPKVSILGTGVAPSSNGFASQAEAIKFRSNPQYEKDSAYRAKFDQMLSNRSY